MKKILLIILAIIILIALAGIYKFNFTNDDIYVMDNGGKVMMIDDVTEEAVRGVAEEVLIALNNNNVESFKKLVHPNKGVRFSSDGVIMIQNDKKYTPSEIGKLIETNEVVLWGYADGSGRSINETFSEYIKQYSRVNYLKASEISYNIQIRSNGANTISNIRDVYKNNTGEEVIQPMSWTTLNLIFEEYDREYYLIGIVKDNWTI